MVPAVRQQEKRHCETSDSQSLFPESKRRPRRPPSVQNGWRRSKILYADPSVETDRLIVSAHKSPAGGQASRIPLFQAVVHAWRMRRVAFCVISNCANFPSNLRDGVESCELPSFTLPVACRNASGVPLTARACTPRFVGRQKPRLVDSASSSNTDIPEQIVKDHVYL